jgi:hypothetical protein
MPTPTETQESFDLEIANPVLLLNEIAKRYPSAPRILMEYLDNGLDDAEALFRTSGGRYPYDIRIEIRIDTRRGEVTIKDNCRGMREETLRRVVRKVGESQKRGCTWVNGQFGFGVHAFRAAASSIAFRTKHQFDDHIVLQFNRDQHRGLRPPVVVEDEFPTDTKTGTIVTLTGFDPIWWSELNAESVKHEIGVHFERLLARPRLVITVRQDDAQPVRCGAFDYDSVPGEQFARELLIEHEGRTYPIEVSLKVCSLPVPDRTPRFFARGRRVNEVRNIRSFISKSRHRTSVWNHDHLIGYIEVGEAVSPVITRDDFVRTQRRLKLYEAILRIEDELKAALDSINQQQRDRRLNRLEDLLRKVLSEMARQDALRYRSEVAGRGQDEPIQGQGGSAVGEAPRGPTQREATGGRGQGGAGEGNGRGPTGAGHGDFPGTGEGGLPPESSCIPANQSAATRCKSGFDIKFMHLPPDSEGRVRRSRLLEGTIIINVGHEDFRSRLDHSRQGQARVTERLINYLAGVVSIHYKDQYYEKYHNQPDRRDQLFDEQVDFICRLETALIPQMGQLQARMDEDLEQGGADGQEAP